MEENNIANKKENERKRLRLYSRKPEEVKEAFAPENHQWLLASDNLSKGGCYYV